MAHDRPAQEHEAKDEDERDRREQHAKAVRSASLVRLLPEGTEREVEGDRTNGENDETDGEDARGDAYEFGIHGSDVITMKAALFDFDETMIDLEREHDFAHRALCRDLGCNYDDLPESFRFGSGRRIVDDITEMRNFFGWTTAEDELYAIRHRHFLEALKRPDLQLMPGVERVVRELHSRGVVLAITTSAAGDAVDLLLRRFGIRDLFALIVDGSEVKVGKPDPEGYLLTARKLGVAPRDCVVFEDSHVGVLAAKAAGMVCVAVRNPRARIVQDLSAADLVTGSFDELNVEELSGRAYC